MISVADLVKKTEAFMTANPGKIDVELTKYRKVKNSSITLSILDRYLYIKKHYDNGSFIADPNFQAVYLDFYQIDNRYVALDFIREYFKLLEESKGWGKKWNEHTMHGYVAARLEPYKNLKGQQTYQCSFISKLLHTANNVLSIYDKNVWEVVDGTGSPAGTSKMPYAGRVNCGVSTLDEIGDLYKDLLCNPTFKSLLGTIKCFRGAKISSEKECDFIFWVMGNCARKAKKTVKS